MQALRFVLLGAVLFALLLFAFNNWQLVPFRLPNGTEQQFPLAALMLIAFAIGFVPLQLFHMASRAHWRHQQNKTRKQLDDALHGARAVPHGEPLPAQAQPIIVPPAGA